MNEQGDFSRYWLSGGPLGGPLSLHNPSHFYGREGRTKICEGGKRLLGRLIKVGNEKSKEF